MSSRKHMEGYVWRGGRSTSSCSSQVCSFFFGVCLRNEEASRRSRGRIIWWWRLLLLRCQESIPISVCAVLSPLLLPAANNLWSGQSTTVLRCTNQVVGTNTHIILLHLLVPNYFLIDRKKCLAELNVLFQGRRRWGEVRVLRRD